MFPRRRYSSSSRPRDYADKLADAMGEGFDADSARGYARGSGPLHRLLSCHREEDEEEEEDTAPENEIEDENEGATYP
jgi:hypothetical protein